MTPARRARGAKRALTLPAAVVLSVAAFALVPAAAGAATTAFQPVADAYVYSKQPATNFGSETTLRVNGASAKKESSYLRFNVQGLNAPVTGAVLRVFAQTNNSGLSLQGVADNSWNENTITYANAPPFGSPVGDSATASGGQWVSLNATSLVQGNGTLSMAITTTFNGERFLSSREIAAQAPQLVVQTAASSDQQIAAAGDISCDPSDSNYNGGLGTAKVCRQLYTSNLLLNPGLAAILPLGDEQYENGTLAAFRTAYDPTWGRVNALTRPAVGNHEYATSGAAGYFDYFDGVGNATGPAGDRGKGYYSYDLGSWHMIALNANCSKVGGCGAGSPQERWLQTDLATHPAACILSYWHQPLFGGTPEPKTGPFWQDLYAAGADIVLNGHIHIYQRFGRQNPSGNADPNGIREFIAGTGGKSHGSVSTASANSGIASNASYGVLQLTLQPLGYDWRFVPEQGGKFSDVGSDSCVAPTVDTEPPSAPQSLTASAASPNQVRLTWATSTDNDGVAGYRVTRDGTVVGSSSTPGTSGAPYADSGLQPGTTYTYTVMAYDVLGNTSPPSSAVTVTTPAG